MARAPFPPKKKLVEGSPAEKALDKKMGVVPAKKAKAPFPPKKAAGPAKPNPFQANKGAPPVAAPAFKKGGKVK